MPFQRILEKYRKYSFSERDKGDRFERLMQAYLRTDRTYSDRLKNVWLWGEFPGKKEFGGKDTGIDLVALTHEGDYWAIQCKCHKEDATIDKPAIDTFLSTSGGSFLNEQMQTVGFERRLFISTTNSWGPTAEGTIANQKIPVTRINLQALIDAPVDWEKLEDNISGEAARTKKKDILPHQQMALDKSIAYYQSADRGKLIMACGTGKTFTSLRIAEQQTAGKGLVLFLVPSIALLGQTLREWSADAQESIYPICICSDAEVSKKKVKDEDSDGMSVIDLALPASTNTEAVVKQLKAAKANAKGLTVAFCTYQSIEVVAQAQKALLKEDADFGTFDLIICDEAHRTAGYALKEEDTSTFMKVHDNNFIRAAKRLYMTATPKLYSDSAKSKIAQEDAVLCSMDDARLYGEEIHRIGFGEAVEKGLLSDYKVLVLTIAEGDMPVAIQKSIADNNEIKSDDVSKLVGCINALSKKLLGDAGVLKATDPEPMRTAVAFCQSIKVSRSITKAFNETQTVYIPTLEVEKREGLVEATAQHVDGAMSAPNRDLKLAWLKGAPADSSECRILTNVRCLSEGVDMPSLDAVMFLSSRNSEVDVVQSVGRVMRRAPGKKYGYIIIPVIVPTYVEPDKALDDNERYKVVWTVLNALRAHDDRFNAIINKIELNKKRPTQILIGTPGYAPPGNNGNSGNINDDGDGTLYQNRAAGLQRQMELEFEKLQDVLFARMVLKVGNRRYWEQWAKNVAEIAERQVERINRIIAEGGEHKAAFEDFLRGLQRNINPGITQQQAVEMLAQHVITKPVFEALFEGYSFVANNPISVSMQQMLDLLEESAIEQDTETLQKFYDSVRKRAAGIDNAEGKQRIIIELYDKFFKTAFPKMVEQLGIVYTPVEVVDFIIHSVADVLESEFGRSISDENVHILDPFTGTGTFITRLLQSGRILAKDLHRKYTREIHANEIVLLAYYIAAVNIENAFHDVLAAALDADIPYEAFNGIVLTDTFQLGEGDGSDRLFKDPFPQNSERVKKQKAAPLRVIIGNPPYSVGQKSANDNAQNQKYNRLDARIAATYANASTATNKNSLYDSYIKAFRWSTDRLDSNGGIVSFVSNGSWLDGNSQDGFRKHLEQEFSSIYVFNLRGNQRTSGELSRKEGGKIFGSGSRTPIAITLLVKNPAKQTEKSTIYYHDIGDYHSREDKLVILKKYCKVSNDEIVWQILQPNENGDWFVQRSDAFESFIPIGDKDNKQSNTFFVPFYSNGVKTQRDAWCYNSSAPKLASNIVRSLDFYNEQREILANQMIADNNLTARGVVSYQASKLSWTRALEWDAEKNKKHSFASEKIRTSVYRPFFKQWLYFSRDLNEMVYQVPKHFPTSETRNVILCISSMNKGFAALVTDNTPDLHFNGDTQCFPLYYYEPREKAQASLFDANAETEYIRRDGISDFILMRAQKQYGKAVSKEDIFYYVYGILHSPQYRSTFAADLKKMLPRLPLVEEPRDFWKFSKAGRALAELHIGYESVAPYEGVTVSGDDSGHYRVEKMRFPKKGEQDSIIYNSHITISNIPAQAYEYVVNGKSAIEWIMERYQITMHKESGITNDPNDWADEAGNPRYILDLLLSVINVSVQTVKIVTALPVLMFANEEQTPAGSKHEETNETTSLTLNTDELVKSYKHNHPIYGIEDVSYILRIRREKAKRWLEDLYHEHQFNGIAPDTQTKGNPLRISFYGLIELAAIKDLRENNIPLKEILNGRDELKQDYNTEYPFATQAVLDSIWKAGRKLVRKNGEDLFKDLGGSGQLNLSFIQQFFERIEFEHGLASRLRPVGKDKLVIVDPTASGGRAYVADIDGNAVWVEQLVSTYRKFKDESRVTKHWNVSSAALSDSLAFLELQEGSN